MKIIPLQIDIIQKVWREIRRPFRKVFGRTPKVSKNPNQAVFCPVCLHGSEKAFLDFNGRANALCAYCGSLERHRFSWLILANQLIRPENSNCSLLHFAPETCLSRHLETFFGVNYVTADIEPGRAKCVVDITDICFPDNKFDYIICNHVLEHIIDDIAALKELYRILKPGGIAYLSVPLFGNSTYEDNSVTSPEERTKHFGQHDHVRRYGKDFIERIKSSGFSVEVKVSSDIMPHDGLHKILGLQGGDTLFIAKKQ